MRKLTVFNNVSADGYFAGPDRDLSWAYEGGDDPEWRAFIAANSRGGGPLLLGRVTYEMMAAYWPTTEAAASAPELARGINALPKIVFSRTLRQPSWSNTRVATSGPVEEVTRLKAAPGDDMVILGSGTIVSQLAERDLIDHYQLVLSPVILGKGRTMFEGVPRLYLKLTSTRAFPNGKVVLGYERAREPRTAVWAVASAMEE